MKKWKWKKALVIAILVALMSTPQQASAMGISSQCGILMDQLTGRVLFEKCTHDQMYIASITKIMTAILAIENGDLEEWVEVTDEVVRQVGSSLYLTVGDELKLMDLIYGLMLRSGNDSAFAIAEAIGEDEATFAEMMNEKGREIGMLNTAFQNASGLDETTYNLSTAYDMAVLMRYAMNNPIFREIAGTQTHRATSKDEHTYVWTNKHKLVTGFYEPAIAGKTGFTKQARRTLVTAATREEMELVVVTLRAGDDWNDHMQLFEYGFNNYHVQKIVEVGELNFSDEQIKERLRVEQDVYLTVRQDGSDEVRTNLVMTQNRGEDTDHVGVLQVILNEEVQTEIPVYAIVQQQQQEQQSSWFNRLFHWFTGAVNPQ